MDSYLNELYAHQAWADAEHWRAIEAHPAALSDKAIRELGWKPRYTQLDDIMRTAWVWHQKRYPR